MTAAAWRRAKLPPLAAALAIACLALLAWTAAARADGAPAEAPPDNGSLADQGGSPTDGGGSGGGDPVTPPSDGGSTENGTGTPAGDQTPADPPPPQNQEPVIPRIDPVPPMD